MVHRTDPANRWGVRPGLFQPGRSRPRALSFPVLVGCPCVPEHDLGGPPTAREGPGRGFFSPEGNTPFSRPGRGCFSPAGEPSSFDCHQISTRTMALPSDPVCHNASWGVCSIASPEPAERFFTPKRMSHSDSRSRRTRLFTPQKQRTFGDAP